MAGLQQDLSQHYECIETHISWVFMTPSDVYKVKKDVRYDFLDFSDIDKRYRACEAEVALNQRLTKSVYHGLLPVTRNQQGQHEIAGQGEIVDWAVHMRRLPDKDRLDIRLSQGRLTSTQLEGVVSRLARFHEDLGPWQGKYLQGGADTVRRNIEENYQETSELLPAYLSQKQILEVQSQQREFLENHQDEMNARSAAGRIREGHGDLRLQHIYLDDSGTINILDCIEFNERFRVADVCSDIVFLAMDLCHSGRSDLAEQVIASYARESNDFDIYTFVDFYESYRAFVRGKVSAFMVDSVLKNHELHTRTKQDARRFFLLSLAAERRSVLPPMVIAVGGIIASGKSTIARRVAGQMSAPVVNADRTRKHLAGIAAQQPVDAASFDGMYSLAFTELTYREVIRRGLVVVQSGRSVILDASFRPRWARELARDMAQEQGVPFLFVECKVDEETCLQRLRARELDRGVSDGRIEIFTEFVKLWEPVHEIDERNHVVLNTAQSVDSNLEYLRKYIPMWPPGLTGP